MALRPPTAPSLDFKAREGFITAPPNSDDQLDESEDVEEVSEDVETDDDFESGEVEEDDVEVFDDSDEDIFDEESGTPDEDDAEAAFDVHNNESIDHSDEPAADHSDQTKEQEPVAHSKTLIDKPATKIEQPPDTGGREGSALPTSADLQRMAASTDRGKAILMEFEEEDRRMAELAAQSTQSEESFAPSFTIDHGVGHNSNAIMWLMIIVIMSMFGFLIVRASIVSQKNQREKAATKSAATTIATDKSIATSKSNVTSKSNASIVKPITADKSITASKLNAADKSSVTSNAAADQSTKERVVHDDKKTPSPTKGVHFEVRI